MKVRPVHSGGKHGYKGRSPKKVPRGHLWHPVVCLMGALIKVIFICIILDAMICVSRGPWLARRWAAPPATRSLWLSMKPHVTGLILQARSSPPLACRDCRKLVLFSRRQRDFGLELRQINGSVSNYFQLNDTPACCEFKGSRPWSCTLQWQFLCCRSTLVAQWRIKNCSL